jgi:hypothetical protein
MTSKKDKDNSNGKSFNAESAKVSAKGAEYSAVRGFGGPSVRPKICPGRGF